MKKRSAAVPQSEPRPGRHVPSADTTLQRTLRAALFAVVLWAAWSVSFVFFSSSDSIAIVVGDPSPRDIKAPRQATYVSDVKTNEAKLAAAAEVQDVYSAPVMELATQQIRRLGDVTNYISAMRSDDYTSPEEKAILLKEIAGLRLADTEVLGMLDAEEQDWKTVVSESLRVLDLVMREEIRSDQIEGARQQVQRLTNHALPDTQQDLIYALTEGHIIANSFFDPDQTEANRQAVSDAVEPVHWTIRAGESVLREGEIATEFALEKLQVLGLIEKGQRWQDRAGIGLLMLVIVVAFTIYLFRSQALLLERPRRQLLLLLTLIGVAVVARLTVPGHTLTPYLFPVAGITMLVTILLDMNLAMVVSAVVSILLAYNASNSLEVMIYAMAGGMIGALTVWRMDHLGAFVQAVFYVSLANVAVVLAFRFLSATYDVIGMAQLVATGVGNAVLSSSMTFVAFSFLGRLFGITTSLQLLELARPTHPLFRQLLMKAPGTYHHSIVISNMAESAADAIGADSLLARVASYYHDIGKISRPYFFAENQSDGENPHDSLDPKTSAEIIISHTTEGIALARKYGLPDRVRDFIPEHHGTTLVTYFYRRATQENPGELVPEEDYRYPGPKPQSREAAIVMLADGVEAWVRANRPPTVAETERVIRQVINDRLVSGQLDECDLTLKDLDRIREAFVNVLQGVFHPRIKYPERSTGHPARPAGGAA
ncbi:MAG: HD family phosphohydrolase [Anaerolineae bacterium]